MSFTAEQRAKALATRRERMAQNNYRTNWADASCWDLLARQARIRLPQWQTPPTPATLRKWHKTLEEVPFRHVYGCSPADLIAMNPTMPLRAFVGMMLERVMKLDQAND